MTLIKAKVHTDSRTEPRADSSSLTRSLSFMSSNSDLLDESPLDDGDEVGPEATVGACRLFIGSPMIRLSGVNVTARPQQLRIVAECRGDDFTHVG